MMRLEYASPMPGMALSWSGVAVLISILSPVAAEGLAIAVGLTAAAGFCVAAGLVAACAKERLGTAARRRAVARNRLRSWSILCFSWRDVLFHAEEYESAGWAVMS